MASTNEGGSIRILPTSSQLEFLELETKIAVKTDRSKKMRVAGQQTRHGQWCEELGRQSSNTDLESVCSCATNYDVAFQRNVDWNAR
jgi:hypothetical protein